ncbi:MAG: COG1615 family transporter [Clostridia bacterium]|nr:COG1615 family transporter [Clostridia bacterium]
MEENQKQETIMDTANTKETRNRNKKEKNKTRMILVIAFIILFGCISYVQLRGNYLEYKELGKQYIDIFYTNMIYRYAIMAINFVILYFIIYFTNKGIKKGLKPFFEKENKPMPKLLNKSLSLVISAIVSIVVSNIFMQKIMLILNSTAFGIQDTIFNLDIAYYLFQKPVMEAFALYFTVLFVGLSIYMALYYVIIFNRFFDGIDGKMLKQSLFMKKLTRNILMVIIGIAIMTLLNTQNMVFGKLLTINDDIDIVGAGMTETTVKLWGYIIFAIVIVVFAYRALKYFKEGRTSKVLKNLAVIPSYLVVLFIIMMIFDLVFVSSNELDKEKEYIAQNIKNTKNAYQINIEEKNLQHSGTITNTEVEKNNNVINNIPIISQEAVLKTLEDSQTKTGYFSYRNANLAKYKVNGKDQVVYVAPREIANLGRTYNNKTYEYTHGMGEIIASATDATQTGNVQYIQKEVSGKDEKIKIEQPRMYFGLETNGMIATNAKNKQEYDYTDENGTDYTSNYEGEAGLQLGFLDRLILSITKGDFNLAFSNQITGDSKILVNRNVIKRAKKALPYLIYDENPYTVVTKEGKIVWVIDAYTVSSNYPYAQYTSIEHDGIKENINYIRNSVKVIVDSYDGTISYYLTDRTDPIAMAYRNIYDTLFVDLDESIPEDITSHFVYPEFLYNVQAEILKIYHNVKPDVLYRADDLWDIAKYNNVKSTKSTGIYMKPYYTMVKTSEGEQFGLVQIYTPDEKQNLISYLVGSTQGGNNQLKLYKFSADSNMVGPMQLDKQIEEDELIATELESLNTTGTKLTKQMIIVPIDNTLLYVEPIYQTMLNESDVPVLKKVIVASGNKVAMGDNLNKALENLLSTYAVDIEVENTDDIEGLMEAIIKANKNLTQSNANNDWEMMGKDVKRLQDLITSLETVKKEEDKKKEELNKTTNQVNTNGSTNVITNMTSNISNDTNITNP